MGALHFKSKVGGEPLSHFLNEDWAVILKKAGADDRIEELRQDACEGFLALENLRSKDVESLLN